MQPILHKTSNHLYRAPKGEEGCSEIGDLPVTVMEGKLFSFWQPSETDIANILAGVPIRLGILAKGGHPPISIEVTNEI